MRMIDGFAREDLLYSENEPDVRNSQRSIMDSVRRLRAVAGAGKPVFVIDTRRARREFGYIGYVGRRDLKGLSPPAFGCGQPDCSR